MQNNIQIKYFSIYVLYSSCFIKQRSHAPRVLEIVMILLVFHSPLWSTDLFSPSSQKVGLCIIMLVGERKEVNTRLLFHIFYRCLVRLTFSTLDKTEEMRWAERPKDMNYYYSMKVTTYTQSMQGCESGCPAAISKNGWLYVQWAYFVTKDSIYSVCCESDIFVFTAALQTVSHQTKVTAEQRTEEANWFRKIGMDSSFSCHFNLKW